MFVLLGNFFSAHYSAGIVDQYIQFSAKRIQNEIPKLVHVFGAGDVRFKS